MKKYSKYLFIIMMCFSLMACGKSEEDDYSGEIAVAATANYKVTYYGATIIDTGLDYNLELSGSVDVPVPDDFFATVIVVVAVPSS